VIPAAVELQPQVAVEIDLQATIIRVTLWVFHEPTTMTATTY
jgi:hypothetical protein